MVFILYRLVDEKVERGYEKVNYPKVKFFATGISQKQGPLGQGSPEKAGEDLDMSHCQYARDEADDNSLPAFEQFLKTPGSKELSLSNSLFSSPVRQSSPSLSGWPLQTIDEEHGEEEDLLSCLQDSTVLLQGATPRMCMRMR